MKKISYIAELCIQLLFWLFASAFVSSLFLRTSGTVVPSKTKIAYHFSTLVLTNGQQHTLQIEPRDEYGNPTSNSTSLTDEANYSVHVHSVSKTYLSASWYARCDLNINCAKNRNDPNNFSLVGTVAKTWSAAAAGRLIPEMSAGMNSSIFLCLFLQLGTVDDDSVEGHYSKSVSLNKQQCQVLLRLTLRRSGCFRTRISYKEQLLSNGEFDIIVLSGEHLVRAASSSNEDV